MIKNQMEDDMVTEVMYGHKPSTYLCCMPLWLAKVTRRGRSNKCMLLATLRQRELNG